MTGETIRPLSDKDITFTLPQDAIWVKSKDDDEGAMGIVRAGHFGNGEDDDWIFRGFIRCITDKDTVDGNMNAHGLEEFPMQGSAQAKIMTSLQNAELFGMTFKTMVLYCCIRFSEDQMILIIDSVVNVNAQTAQIACRMGYMRELALSLRINGNQVITDAGCGLPNPELYYDADNDSEDDEADSDESTVDVETAFADTDFTPVAMFDQDGINVQFEGFSVINGTVHLKLGTNVSDARIFVENLTIDGNAKFEKTEVIAPGQKDGTLALPSIDFSIYYDVTFNVSVERAGREIGRSDRLVIRIDYSDSTIETTMKTGRKAPGYEYLDEEFSGAFLLKDDRYTVRLTGFEVIDGDVYMKLETNAPGNYKPCLVNVEVDGSLEEKVVVSDDTLKFVLPSIKPQFYYDLKFKVAIVEIDEDGSAKNVAAVSEDVMMRLDFANKAVTVTGGVKPVYECKPDNWLVDMQLSRARHNNLGGFGAFVIVNGGGGTDFEPQYLADMDYFEDKKSGQVLDAFEKNDSYTLDATAKRLAKVFRVDKDRFNSQLDAEALILEGMYRHVQDFNLMRSFAWTLAKRTEDDGKALIDADMDVIREVCAYVEDHDGMNFKDEDVFGVLCGNPDLHTNYVPQAIISSDLKKEFPEGEILASLEGLRQDLAALEPAMRLIYNELLKDRDRTKPLCDDDASANSRGPAMARVLYAWCAYAVAAARPFFHEDGPRWFDCEYPDTPIESVPVPLYSGVPVLPVYGRHAEKQIEDDGYKRVEFGRIDGEPCVWRVLGRMENGELLLMSEHAEFCSHYGLFLCNKWEDSEIYKMLNDELPAKLFTQDEFDHICSHDWPVRGVQSAEMKRLSTEKITIPDAAEMMSLLPEAKDRVCEAGAKAIEQGIETRGRTGECKWWLRCDPAIWAIRVNEGGNLDQWATREHYGIRPMILVDCETGDRLLNGAQVPSLKVNKNSVIVYEK